MSSSSYLYDSSSSEEEFDTEEDEDIAMIVALHKSKWPKKGCGRQGLMDNWLMLNYFVKEPVFPSGTSGATVGWALSCSNN
jgi:hypothetical protein